VNDAQREEAQRCARVTRSETGLDRRRHPAKKAPGQAVMVPQDERRMPSETAVAHICDITIQPLSRNEGAAIPGRKQAREP
jgi:hypothetical protein